MKNKKKVSLENDPQVLKQEGMFPIKEDKDLTEHEMEGFRKQEEEERMMAAYYESLPDIEKEYQEKLKMSSASSEEEILEMEEWFKKEKIKEGIEMADLYNNLEEYEKEYRNLRSLEDDLEALKPID